MAKAKRNQVVIDITEAADIVYPAIIFGALVILGLVMLLSQRKGK